MNPVLFECYVDLMDFTDNEKSSFRKYNQDFAVSRDIFHTYWSYLGSNLSSDNLVYKIYDTKISKLDEKLINNSALFRAISMITNDLYKFDRDYHGKCNNYPFWLYRLYCCDELIFDYFEIDDYFNNSDYGLLVDTYLAHIGAYLRRYYLKYNQILRNKYKSKKAINGDKYVL